MPDPTTSYIGEISIFGFNFTPRGWMTCAGQLLPISQHQALFGLIGTQFGGDGHSVFQLPQFASRMPVGATRSGAAPGLSTFEIGQSAGNQSSLLDSRKMPAHTHNATFAASGATAVDLWVDAYDSGASVSTPAADDLIAGSSAFRFRSPGGFGEPAKVPLGGVAISGGGTIAGTVAVESTGSSLPFDTQSPGLGVNFCICSEGLFPSRS